MFQDLVQPIYKGGRGSSESNSSATSKHAQTVHKKPLKAALASNILPKWKHQTLRKTQKIQRIKF